MFYVFILFIYLLIFFFQMIISKFSKVPEPEFPGHVILEQYQAQVCEDLKNIF